jgi:hypothetical protein
LRSFGEGQRRLVVVRAGGGEGGATRRGWPRGNYLPSGPTRHDGPSSASRVRPRVEAAQRSPVATPCANRQAG